MTKVTTVKYSDVLGDWLVELGYTHCFFLAGGGSMHLLDGVRTRFTCIPTVHEVAAGIAADYFNESGGPGKAFVLVTAGPGLTNVVTALSGAYLESRELLVIGGQVKSVDLASNGIRQRGIQEVDGVALARPVCVVAERIERPVDRDTFVGWVEQGYMGRPGPVFIEVCLDVQGAPVDRAALEATAAVAGGATSDGTTAGDGPVEVPMDPRKAAIVNVPRVSRLMARAHRPVWLLGGGVRRETAERLTETLRATGVPLMTTWNGADRLDADEPLNFGRPNTWGQRAANVLIQQADLVVVFGSRLGLQQTGFNWEQFAPLGKVVQCHVDRAELTKGHPQVDLAICADANSLLEELAARSWPSYEPWVEFCTEVRSLLPLRDPANVTGPGYVCPYEFFGELSALSRPTDVVIPCSSGGANFMAMQALRPKRGQVIITSNGLASMGYGLSGALGASLAHPGRRTLLVEGDGGFSQNLQELATVAVNNLDLKIFLFCNEGYGSIRATQRNYFGGAYLGCDTQTGVGFPEWPKLFEAYGIPLVAMDDRGFDSPGVREALERPGPCGINVPIDPDQTGWPRIASRVTASGGMESNPLHLMTPELDDELAAKVLRYFETAAPSEVEDELPALVPVN